MELKEVVLTHWMERRPILAVNAINLETSQAIVAGAERVGKPIFLMISQNAAQYGGLEELAAIAKTLKARAQVPVFLHLDHAESLEVLERAFSLGFDSAMVEEGPLEFLREARTLAGPRPLEVELEVVRKGERLGKKRGLEELLALVEAIQPDWIAVDLGTVHKSLETHPLDLERLRELLPLRRPLVLHGGSSAEARSVKAAISLGVVKVNLATRAYAAFTQGVHEALEGVVDPRIYLGRARDAMANFIASYYNLLLDPGGRQTGLA